MHSRYLAILALILIGAAGLLGVLFGLQQGFWIRHHEKYAAENREKAGALQRTGQLEQARWAEEDAMRDARYAAEARRNRLLGVVLGGGVAGASALGIVALLIFKSAGRSATGGFDAFLQAYLQPRLRTGEQVLNTAFVFEGSLRRATTYCAALTNQRLLLVRTGVTPFMGRPIYQGEEAIELSEVGNCTAGGVGFHRELTLVFRDGRTRNLRLNMLADAISGQEAFLAEAPKRLAGNRVEIP